MSRFTFQIIISSVVLIAVYYFWYLFVHKNTNKFKEFFWGVVTVTTSANVALEILICMYHSSRNDLEKVKASCLATCSPDLLFFLFFCILLVVCMEFSSLKSCFWKLYKDTLNKTKST